MNKCFGVIKDLNTLAAHTFRSLCQSKMFICLGNAKKLPRIPTLQFVCCILFGPDAVVPRFQQFFYKWRVFFLAIFSQTDASLRQTQLTHLTHNVSFFAWMFYRDFASNTEFQHFMSQNPVSLPLSVDIHLFKLPKTSQHHKGSFGLA